MEIIRFADRKPQPRRNGGGVTRQIAGHPRAASLQDGGWDWRVSIAEVTKAGDFPPFPGMERVLTVVEGELLLLTVDGAEHPLEKYRPFRFPGGAATACALPTEMSGTSTSSPGPAASRASRPSSRSPRHAPIRCSPASWGSCCRARPRPRTEPMNPKSWAVTTPWWARIPRPRRSWAAASWPSCPSTRSLPQAERANLNHGAAPAGLLCGENGSVADEGLFQPGHHR